MKKKTLGKFSYLPREYKGINFDKMVLRPGSMNILRQPSRMGNILYYPDGRIVKVDDDRRRRI